MAATISIINSSRPSTASGAHYAAIAEALHGLSLEGLLVAHQRVRADIADAGFKVSDAATTGMIAEEERLIAAIAALPPEGIRDIRLKAECYQQTFCDEGLPTKSSAMLHSAIVSDLRLLERRG
ncbi:MAG: hypothetical protein HEQ16_13120 [Bosea sp.]|nr:hypothetical protein [Bosea sp. (in: a-proteobacteria)]